MEKAFDCWEEKTQLLMAASSRIITSQKQPKGRVFSGSPALQLQDTPVISSISCGHRHIHWWEESFQDPHEGHLGQDWPSWACPCYERVLLTENYNLRSPYHFWADKSDRPCPLAIYLPRMWSTDDLGSGGREGTRRGKLHGIGQDRCSWGAKRSQTSTLEIQAEVRSRDVSRGHPTA